MNTKQAYVDKMDSNIRQWQADIEKLNAAADESVADAKIDGNKKVQELKQKIETVEAQLSALKEKGEDAWEEMKSQVDSAANDLSHKIEELRDSFKA